MYLKLSFGVLGVWNTYNLIFFTLRKALQETGWGLWNWFELSSDIFHSSNQWCEVRWIPWRWILELSLPLSTSTADSSKWLTLMCHRVRVAMTIAAVVRSFPSWQLKMKAQVGSSARLHFMASNNWSKSWERATAFQLKCQIYTLLYNVLSYLFFRCAAVRQGNPVVAETWMNALLMDEELLYGVTTPKHPHLFILLCNHLQPLLTPQDILLQYQLHFL